MLEEEGPIPTQTKIAQKLEISQSSVSRHIRNLINKGRVEKDDKGYDVVERNPEGNVNIFESLGKLYESPQLEKIGSNILNITRNLERYVKRWKDGLTKISEILPEIIPKIPEIVEALREEWSVEIKKANEKLIPHGWVFTPAIPINILTTFNDLKNEKEIEEIIEILVEERFTVEECRRILDDVLDHPLFNKRSAALEEAFKSYKEGWHYVAIPAFLAQMEGAYIEAFEEELHLFKREELAELSGDDPIRDALIDGLNSLMVEQLAEHSNEIEKAFFNRNLVMHGNWAEYGYKYGTKENSIKSILLLDFVKFVIEEKEELDSKEKNSKG